MVHDMLPHVVDHELSNIAPNGARLNLTWIFLLLSCIIKESSIFEY